MEHGFLRYEVRLVSPDGSEKVIEKEATQHRCTILENRYKKAKGLGLDNFPSLRFRVSKII